MRSPLFSRLAEPVRREIIMTAARRRFGRNEVIIREGELGDTLHIIDKGRVAVRVNTPLGDVATLAVRGRGETFGEQALVSRDMRRNATVVALEPVETFVITRTQFDEFRREYPSVQQLLVELLSARLTDQSARLVEAMYLPAEQRVERRLAELCEIYGTGAGVVEIKVTQQDLATMAGTTRPTVNRVLQDLQAKGVLELRRGRVRVANTKHFPTANQ